MAPPTQSETRVQTPILSRAGHGTTVVAVIVLALPLLYALFARLTGAVALSTAGQITSVVWFFVITVAGGLVLALAATALYLLGRRTRAEGQGIGGLFAIGASGLVALIALALLLVGVLPRALAVQHLQSTIVPFATSMRDNCKAPLNKTTADLTKARDDTQANLSSNPAFSAAIRPDIALIQADATALSTAASTLQGIQAPDSRYQPLLDDCRTTVKGEYDFLTNANGPNAIKLPPPFNAFVPTVSGIDLLQDAALITSGAGPIKVQPGQVQPLVAFALDQVLAVTNPKLTAEGDQLTGDIQHTLDSNLAPFKVTVPIG